MHFQRTRIPDVMIIEPQVFADARGAFIVTWERSKFAAAGVDVDFVQDNHSVSRQNVLRGLHYQVTRPQAKLVRVVRGEVFDVVVDLRRSSQTFGKWIGEKLSAENRRMMWIPAGFAHGYLVTSEEAEFVYKCTDYYDPAGERTLAWDDPALNIRWPSNAPPVLSEKDSKASRLDQADTYP